MASLHALFNQNEFIHRHIGPTPADIESMLQALGAKSLTDLIEQTVPENILRNQPLAMGDAVSEAASLSYLKSLANKNQVFKSHIGMGYYPCYTPSVILRNILENPGWYTAYTPYQPEISQGRLEALMNFQQMVMDLTAMDIANASLLDEGTAAAEAMSMSKRVVKKNTSNRYIADAYCHPQTLAVLKTRAEHFAFELVISENMAETLAAGDYFGVLLQYPNSYGAISDIQPLIDEAHKHQAIVTVASDLLALCLLKAPGEMAADIVVGNSQRFGVPMGFGGPHAAFFACKDAFKRQMPGRVIGVSKDKDGNMAYRMAMQTREQHIRREKATSNICTAQALLAIIASSFAVYHGPQGLTRIATRIARLTQILANGLKQAGFEINNAYAFDTLSINSQDKTDAIYQAALAQRINLRKHAQQLIISLDETTTLDDVSALLSLFGKAQADLSSLDNEATLIPEALKRQSAFLTHPVFNRHQSETQMLRYLKQLENKDISLTHSMIALGSCTMKLNATSEMLPISWPEFAHLHPFAPTEQSQGYQQLVNELEQMLKACTGYDAISFQPNAGSQGEYAGLLVIKSYFASLGETQRNICLIPSSAHGTNPASAAMANLDVVITKCDSDGNIDLADLTEKVQQYGETIAAIMVTYPSTHGVFEQNIKQVCELIHSVGAQVYIDGANLNAMVGIAAPGLFGADVSHLNLHKTFAIPHGGGGPGMGPIGVKQHLAEFLPRHPLQQGSGDVISSAQFGSAGILPISWSYIKMMGANGLLKASQVAILNANYIAKRLADYYPVLYRGKNQRVAHECIIDIRPLKEQTGISEEDIAKRLIDYGFHAPTMSFPVAGTLMIEPTESESLDEIDRFCDSLIAIHHEILNVKNGVWPKDDNPLVNAPHTHQSVLVDNWPHAYSREQAAYPLAFLRSNKYWPSVRRIDNVYGDKNLFCACPAIETYL